MKLLFDIGATHLRVAVAGAAGPESIHRVPTPSAPTTGVEAFAALAHELGSSIESAIGGVAGDIEPGGVLEHAANLPAWNGFALHTAFEQALNCPVTLMNDAEVAGLGEARYGAGKGYATVAYIGFGTGVGTSLIRDREIVPGMSGKAGRLAIVTLTDGRSVEDVVGGRSLEKQYGVPAEELPHDVWQSLTPFVVEVVGNAITKWTPDIVVLAGSLMNPENGFNIEDVRRLVTTETPIVQSALGDSCGLWGAYALSH